MKPYSIVTEHYNLKEKYISRAYEAITIRGLAEKPLAASIAARAARREQLPPHPSKEQAAAAWELTDDESNVSRVCIAAERQFQQAMAILTTCRLLEKDETDQLLTLWQAAKERGF